MTQDISLPLIIKNILKYIIYSNTLISLSCGVLTWGFCIFTQLANALHYGVLAFFGTFFVYSFQRIVKNKQQTNASLHMLWVEKHFSIVLISTCIAFIGFNILLFYLINWNVTIILLGLVATLICAFYIIRVRGKNLRELPYIKIHLISSVWVFMICIFPLVNEQHIDTDNWFFGIAHYIYILAISIPFDIRDMAYDNANQKTIPQVVGVQSAKMIAILLLVCFIFISMTFQERLASNHLFFIAVICQLFLVYFTTKKRHVFYFGGLIDGFILLLGLSYFF